ncbi:amino acid ABC transporter permease [Faecalispora anaeroviscerum]|uniref:amino acid ABC transporter permease n=1 Tax=Faecalispora anaeroviscerum TaxID=2991836 RepID=UPI0024BA8804|nr:amino acid ABC transporter permease [Faecalispora anaeroviscerum]
MLSGTVILEDMQFILTVVPFTLGTALIVLSFGILLGFAVAIVRIRQVPVAKQLARVFMDYTRGIPLVIHLYLAYFILPMAVEEVCRILGMEQAAKTSPLAVLVVAYSLYISVGQSENIRGAFSSIDPGQWDAAYACGMNGFQALFKIVIPQGVTVAVPVFFNTFLGITKGLSLAFTIGVADILSQAKLASAQNAHYLEAYIAAALIYWALCGLLDVVFGRVERVFKKW